MRYKLAVKYPVKLLEEVLDIFCENARLSLEGDLSKCNFTGLSVVVDESRSELTVPQNSNNRYVVIELNNSTADIIKKQILSMAGVRSRIWHWVVTKDETIVFASYDNFDPDCVWVSDQIKSEVLDVWVSKEILRGYELMPE